MDFAAPVGYQEPQRQSKQREGQTEVDGQVSPAFFVVLGVGGETVMVTVEHRYNDISTVTKSCIF